MLELVNVELTNFRSFANATFSPLGMGQGMTAINGANGSGKSSITHAICFALYGITPDGVPVKALRKQGSEGEVRATVTFRHNGDTIIVSRALRGRNDSTIASITLNGIEETSVSTRTATAWVVNRLGLDAEAFLTAFVVRQKELDNLVKARPAERRKIIERLAGIERMSLALELARSNAKQAQRVLEALPESEDPEIVKEKHEQTMLDLESATKRVELVKEEETIVEQAVINAQASLTEGQSAINNSKSAEHKLQLSEQTVLNLKRETEKLRLESIGYETLEEVTLVAEQTRVARNKAEMVAKEVDSFISKANSDSERLTLAENNCAQFRGLINKYTEIDKDLDIEINSLPEELNSLIEALDIEIKELSQNKGAVRGEWDRLTKAITNLKTTSTEHAECPTCLRVLEDVETLITSLQTSLDRVQQEGESISSLLKIKESELTALSKQKTNKTNLINKKASNNTALDSAKEALVQAEKEESRLADIAETSAEEAHEAKVSAKVASESLPDLILKEKNAQSELRKIENAVKSSEELPMLEVDLEHAIRAMGVTQAELDIAQEILSNISLKDLEESLSLTSSDLRNILGKVAQSKADYSLALRSLELSKTALEIAEKSATVRKDAMLSWEKQSALATAMDEFRRDRLARLAPELSEVASDLISRMTDGKYTTVELDEDFTPILTDSTGTERPVAWLSGGEESTVALALRVAIGEVLAGQSGGLLILDEVLTAQDTLRRQATMGAIRALPRQIITINHISEATDMVDLVADVIDDGEGGSTIVESSPADSLGSNISDELLISA